MALKRIVGIEKTRSAALTVGTSGTCGAVNHFVENIIDTKLKVYAAFAMIGKIGIPDAVAAKVVLINDAFARVALHIKKILGAVACGLADIACAERPLRIDLPSKGAVDDVFGNDGNGFARVFVEVALHVGEVSGKRKDVGHERQSEVAFKT